MMARSNIHNGIRNMRSSNMKTKRNQRQQSDVHFAPTNAPFAFERASLCQGGQQAPRKEANVSKPKSEGTIKTKKERRGHMGTLLPPPPPAPSPRTTATIEKKATPLTSGPTPSHGGRKSFATPLPVNLAMSDLVVASMALMCTTPFAAAAAANWGGGLSYAQNSFPNVAAPPATALGIT